MGGSLRILLIDDDSTDRMAVTRALSKSDLEVEITEADDGASGVRAFKAGDFDCVLLDYRLPDIDGIGVLPHLVEPEGRGCAVIVLTGQGNDQLALELMEAGAVDYLSKGDISPGVLQRAIRYALARQQYREANLELMGQLKVANQELQSANDRLRVEVEARTRAEAKTHEANEMLASANADLETFCYSVSHDLRAPLRSIRGFTEALLEDCNDHLDRTGQEYLGKITAAVGRSDELITKMLSMARAERTPMQPCEVDLTDIARSVIDALTLQAPHRRVECSIGDGLAVTGDADLLFDVMENLLGNAWKFTSKRDPARIEVGEHPTGNGIRAFFVRDNGAGFDAEAAKDLATPFRRFHAAEDFQGTGIGLATVDKIVRRHGGKLWAASAPDQGATFYFSLQP